MIFSRRFDNRGALAALAVAGLSSFFGCGSDDLPMRYPVSGTVKYQGKPVESGTISFTPDDLHGGRSAGGVIKDGSYSLSSFGTEDGAMPGRYKVSIAAQRTLTDGLDPKLKLMYQKALATGGVPIPPQVKKKVKVEDLVPKKYFSPETSELTATVSETHNSIDFPLKD